MIKLYANVHFVSLYVPLSDKNKMIYNYLQPKTTYEINNLRVFKYNYPIFQLYIITIGEY